MRVARDLNEARLFADEVEEIRLAGQGLSDLDDDMPLMPNLRILDLSENNLRTLPAWIWNQASLEQLSFKANKIDMVPSGIAQLSKLKRLVADKNPILGFQKLPVRLKEVFANQCLIRAFPESLLDCAEIQVIEMSGCKMREVETRRSLPMGLVTIDLSYNQILRFPFSLFRTAGLKSVKLDGNPLFKYLGQEIDTKLISRFFADTYRAGWEMNRRNCALDVLLENVGEVDEWSQEDLLEVVTCDFGYVREQALVSIVKFWASPFQEIAGFRMAVDGRLKIVRRVDLEHILAKGGNQLVEEVSTPEDVLIIASGAKGVRGKEALARGVKIGFEGHLIEWIRQGHSSSLVKAGLENPMVGNLLSLLTSSEIANVEMALQLMKGTGVPIALRGTLTALRMLSSDPEIRRMVDSAFMEVAGVTLRKLVAFTIRECFHEEDHVNFQGVVERMAGRMGSDLFPFLKMAWEEHSLGKGWVMDLSVNEQAAILDLMENCEGLDLNGIGFPNAPEGLWTERKIVFLNLSRNGIADLDGRIGKFRNLQALDLSENFLYDLPDGLFDLKDLESLDLSRNVIPSLDGRWEDLHSLKALKIGKNPLETVPEGLSRLKNLEMLDMRRIKPSILAPTLAGLACLKDLDLGQCELKFLPAVLKDFHQLESLSVERNQIKKLPDWLGELPNLKHLDIGFLEISRLPEGLAAAPKLEIVQLEQNNSMEWEQVADVLSKIPTLRRIAFPRNIIPSVKRMLESKFKKKMLASYSHGYDLPF